MKVGSVLLAGQGKARHLTNLNHKNQLFLFNYFYTPKGLAGVYKGKLIFFSWFKYTNNLCAIFSSGYLPILFVLYTYLVMFNMTDITALDDRRNDQ